MSRSDLVVRFLPCESALRSYHLPLSIAKETIDVWGFELHADQQWLELSRGWLDAEERSRADRLVDDRHRLRYVLSHGTLRALLSRYTQGEPGDLTFRREPAGKPVLVQPGVAVPLMFSAAHSHERMVVGVSKGNAVGIDLERIRRTVDPVKLAERFYRPAERDLLAGLSQPRRLRQFFRYWVAKEAVLKGEGVGLASLQHCEVLAGRGDRTGALISADQPQHREWNVAWLSCGDEWEGAVAYPEKMDLRLMPV